MGQVAATVRTALIDDHPLFRKGMVALLTSEPGIEVVGEAGNEMEARRLLESGVDLAIIDVLLPGVSGISIASDVVDLAPRCRVLALSVVDEPGLIADMFRAGASGFALKTQPPEQILEAVRCVLGGVRYLPPSVARGSIDAELGAATASRLERLTRREREIFELLIRGYGNGDIAARLYIAVRTVETHRHHIMRKLSARSITEMQRLAARHGGI